LAFDQSLVIRHGVWSSLGAKQTSNFRELSNVIDTLKEGVKSGHLHNTEVFLFTDNMAAEAAYGNGTSKSKLLFNLALDLRELEMSGLLQFFVIHVSGSRMMSQGTDALSCGALSDGIMHDGDRKDQPNILPLTPDAWYRSRQGFAWVNQQPEELLPSWLLWVLPMHV
jgi:hypothetical protein